MNDREWEHEWVWYGAYTTGWTGQDRAGGGMYALPRHTGWGAMKLSSALAFGAWGLLVFGWHGMDALDCTYIQIIYTAWHPRCRGE
jgi:hypothetical protein